jgi:hypothetical protein
MYSWSSWHTLVPLLVSAAGLVAFVVWEERFAAEPLIRFSVMKSRTTAVAYLGDFLQVRSDRSVIAVPILAAL